MDHTTCHIRKDGGAVVVSTNYIINDTDIYVAVRVPANVKVVDVMIGPALFVSQHITLKVDINVFDDVDGNTLKSLIECEHVVATPLMDKFRKLLYYKCVGVINHEIYFSDAEYKHLVPAFRVNVVDANTITYMYMQFRTQCDFSDVLRKNSLKKVSTCIYDQLLRVFSNTRITSNVKSAR